MRILVIVAVLLIISVPGPTAAAKTQSEDDAKWQQVDNTNKARELYLAGEAANKKSDYRTAVKCWMAAMELKPDSDFTRKCLVQAREKLYKQFSGYERQNQTRDPLTCCVMLEEMVTLVPGKPDLPGRLERATGSLNANQVKALASYKKALELYTKRDPVSAKTALADAEQYAGNADCVIKLARALCGLPKLIWLGAEWCPACRASRPIIEQLKTDYDGKIDIVIADSGKDVEMSRKYNVARIPTLVLQDSSGKQVGRWEGGPSRQFLVKEFAKIGVK